MKYTINNLYPLSLIRTFINGYKWNVPLSLKYSLILNILLNKHWSKTQIKGHHMEASKLLFELLHKSDLTVQILSKSTRCHNYLWLHPNQTYFWPRKVETIIYKIIHHSPPLWPYLPTIYQALLQYNLFCSMILSEKTST